MLSATAIYDARSDQVAATRGGPAGRRFTVTPPRALADAVERLADRSGVSPETLIHQALWQFPQLRRELRR